MKCKRILSLVVFLALAMSAIAKGKPRDWQEGKLLDTDRKGFFWDDYWTYTIETSDHVYVLKEEIRWAMSWAKPARLEVNRPVHFAVEGDTVYLHDDDGKDHKTHLVKAILKPGPPPPTPSNTAAPSTVPPQIVKQADVLDLSAVIFKSTPDGADITVNGKYVGSTPSTVRLSAGDHSISIEKGGYKTWQRTMTVSPGGNVTIDATLEKVP